MAVNPPSQAFFTVKTNGQSLVVSAGSSASVLTAELFSDAANATALTSPVAITSDTTFYLAPGRLNREHYISVKQPDGTELFGQMTGLGVTIEPLPSKPQVASDAAPLIFGGLPTGYYYATGQSYSVTTHATNLSQLRVHPWFVPHSISITKIGAEITTAGSTGAVVRLGIYADNGAGYPGALVLDAGTIDGTSQTVQDITLGAAQPLSRGLYWVGFAAQTATSTIRAFAAPTHPMPIAFGASAPTAGQIPATYVQTSVTGSLPANFSSTRVIGAAGSAGRVHVLV